jgi:uncharacterized protein (TIGR00730 family)
VILGQAAIELHGWDPGRIQRAVPGVSSLAFSSLRSLCVFCGSATGSRPVFAETARDLGERLPRLGIELIYGGGRVGLMGVLADAALAAGGRVVGVIPQELAKREVAHDGLTKLHVVHSMHQRKALMAELAQAFLTLPGGIGTFEEFFEILTWRALGFHHKPIGILNVDHYFNPLLTLLDHAAALHFVRRDALASLLISDDAESLLHQLASLANDPSNPADPAPDRS